MNDGGCSLLGGDLGVLVPSCNRSTMDIAKNVNRSMWECRVDVACPYVLCFCGITPA